MIGDCGITMQTIHGSIKPEIGYHIKKEHQGKGYATEAAIACKDFIFEHTPFQRIYTYMKDTNVGSYKVAIKNGMQLIEEYEDSVNTITKVYAISRKEWEQQRVIWFGWHIPLLLNRELVTEFPLWQGACFFLIEVLCITFIMGALSDSKYGASIWVYISLHAVHNILIQAMVKAFGEGQAKLINDGGYLINLVLLVAAALFGWKRIRKRKKR